MKTIKPIINIYFLLSLFYMVIAYPASGISSPQKSGGKLNCTPQNIHIGKIKKNTRIEQDFYLKNTGNDTIKIEEYSVSCNCTSLQLSDTLIGKEQTGILKMIIDTSDKYPGFYEIDAVLKTNGLRKFYRLTLRFEIE